VHRLHFIRHARDLGFSVEEIRQLLALSEQPAMPCDTATEIAHHHLREVESKIARLRLIRSELKRMIEACDGGCAADCRILEAISHEAAPKSEQARKAARPRQASQ
jgi:DNA-binding transcriptional MerR regulator